MCEHLKEEKRKNIIFSEILFLLKGNDFFRFNFIYFQSFCNLFKLKLNLFRIENEMKLSRKNGTDTHTHMQFRCAFCPFKKKFESETMNFA